MLKRFSCIRGDERTWAEEHDLKLAEMKRLREQDEARLREHVTRSPLPIHCRKARARFGWTSLTTAVAWGKGGTATLSVNGKKVAQGRVENTVANVFAVGDTFDVGEDCCTPVSPTYTVPFKFTGKINLVTIESQPPNLSLEHQKTLHETKTALVASAA